MKKSTAKQSFHWCRILDLALKTFFIYLGVFHEEKISVINFYWNASSDDLFEFCDSVLQFA